MTKDELIAELESGHAVHSSYCEQAAALLKDPMAYFGACLGVGRGNGKLFVYGDSDSLHAARTLILERDNARLKLSDVRDQLMGALITTGPAQVQMVREALRILEEK